MAYTQKQKEHIIQYYNENGITKTEKRFNVTNTTIYRWINPKRQQYYTDHSKKYNIKEWLKRHPGYGKRSYHKWVDNNPEKIKQTRKLWYEKHKQKILVDSKYKSLYQEVQRRRQRERYKTDIKYKLICCLRSRLTDALKRYKKADLKTDKTLNLIGCTIKDLMQHLEMQFKSGMSWDNYGEWQIDHIKMVSEYNLLDPEEQRACFHYTNLQPLWRAENNQKQPTKKPRMNNAII